MAKQIFNPYLPSYEYIPDRDFVYGGRIHSTSDVGINGYTVDSPAYPVGNTHGGIACVNGQYYIFDHRLTNNSSFCRQGVAEPINIDKNGFIKQVESTSCGLNNSPLLGCGTYPAYIACNIIDNNIYVSKEEKIGKSLCITQDGPDREEGENQYITNFHDKCILGFKYFDIEKISTIVMQVRGCASGKITVSTDKNQLVKVGVSEVNINSEKWISVEIPVKIDAGKQALFFGYTGEGCFEFMELKLVNIER